MLGLEVVGIDVLNNSLFFLSILFGTLGRLEVQVDTMKGNASERMPTIRIEYCDFCLLIKVDANEEIMSVHGSV